MKKLLVLLGFVPSTLFAQISYTVTVTKLKAKADDCDGGIVTLCSQAPQDPVINIWTNDSDANEFTNCWVFENDPEAEYNLWKDIQNLEIANVSNTSTTFISFDMSGFESDAPISTGCTSIVGDDAVYERQFVQQIELANIPENTDHLEILDLDDVYFAEVIIRWFDANLGLSASVQDLNFSLVPNPTNGIFKINLESQGIDQFTAVVRDLSGRLVLRQEALHHQSEIDLGMQESGVYLVSVETNEIIKTERILLQ